MRPRPLWATETVAIQRYKVIWTDRLSSSASSCRMYSRMTVSPRLTMDT